MNLIPTELILQIMMGCDPEIQLVLRTCSKTMNTIFLLTSTLPTLQELARTGILKAHVQRIHDEMQEFYEAYGSLGFERFPSFLRKDSVLVNLPFRLSGNDEFLDYLANVLLLQSEDDIFRMSLTIAINLATEPQNGLGCYILKNRKLMQRLFTEVEMEGYYAEYIVLLIANLHDHRNHLGTTCPFTGNSISCNHLIQTLTRCKRVVNAYYQRNPQSEDAEFAATMWNTTPRI